MVAVTRALESFLPFTLAFLSSAFQSQTVKISQDLNRIGRLRYDVYEHESRLPESEEYFKQLFKDHSNHEEKTVLDDDMDHSGINFVLENESTGQLSGCLRLNFGSLQESMAEWSDLLMDINIQDLVGADDQTGFYVSRLAIAPGKRGRLSTAKLCAEAFHYSRQRGGRWAYIVASEKLTRMYKKMGFEVVAEKHLGSYGMFNLNRLDLSQDYAWLRNPKKQ